MVKTGSNEICKQKEPSKEGELLLKKKLSMKMRRINIFRILHKNPHISHSCSEVIIN